MGLHQTSRQPHHNRRGVQAERHDFSNDVVKFNTWFDDTRKSIIKEEGPGKYNEYLRSLFNTYLGCANIEFVESIKDEKRKWTQGKLPPTYLLELGRVTFNNISQDEEGWKMGDLSGEKRKMTDNPTNEKKPPCPCDRIDQLHQEKFRI